MPEILYLPSPQSFSCADYAVSYRSLGEFVVNSVKSVYLPTVLLRIQSDLQWIFVPLHLHIYRNENGVNLKINTPQLVVSE